MLDMLCLSGDIGWARLTPPGVMKMTPVTPVALFLREHAALWRALRARDEHPLDARLSGDARIVLERLKTRGASFFRDLTAGVPFDVDRLRHALGVLVAAGLAASDGFSGLRIVRAAARGRPVRDDRRSNFAGRWTALAHDDDPGGHEAGVDRQAHALLRRYGIVFRRLLTREPNATPWRELTRVYRRLEARGEIRGGRFVAGMAGEQFALPDAVPLLRDVRRTPCDGRLSIICTADPLNLTGIVTAGQRVRAAGRNRMAYRDGTPVAVIEADDVRTLTPLGDAETAEVAHALSRRRAIRVA